MSEASDKVWRTHLPCFRCRWSCSRCASPAAHLRPAYRQMLTDIPQERICLRCRSRSEHYRTRSAPGGRVGCVAEVTETQTFPDGRSNILTLGVIRYRIEDAVERGDQYLVARVTYFEDDEEDESSLTNPAREVAGTFTWLAQAVRTLNDERSNLPDISDTELSACRFWSRRNGDRRRSQTGDAGANLNVHAARTTAKHVVGGCEELRRKSTHARARKAQRA